MERAFRRRDKKNFLSLSFHSQNRRLSAAFGRSIFFASAL